MKGFIKVTLSNFDIEDCGELLPQVVLERLDAVYGYYCTIVVKTGEFQSIETNVVDQIENIEFLIDDCCVELWPDDLC